jgi:hypothetical protein
LRTRFGNRVDDGRTLDRFQALQFVAQLIGATLRQGNRAHRQTSKQKNGNKKAPRLSASRLMNDFDRTPLNRGMVGHVMRPQRVGAIERLV